MSGDDLYLRHVLDGIATIERYVQVGEDEFMAESHWQDAVIRQLTNIGEAVKRISRRPAISGPRSLGVKSPACGMSSSTNISVWT